MVAPVQAWQIGAAESLGLRSPLVVTTLSYLVALVAAPALLVGLAIAIGAHWLEGPHRRRQAARFAYALVPLGFSMWLAHYTLHLVTSWRSALPAAQRSMATLGLTFLGAPEWTDACCRPVAAWLPRLEIAALDLGLLLSLYAGIRIARGRSAGAWKAFVPWAVVLVLLFAAGVWIVLQPMQMRGTFAGAG
jgi:hypothetical protein